MMNRLNGVGINGENLWMAEQLNETYDNIWIGSARNIGGLTRHISISAAIQFYLMHEPNTDTIQAVIDERYRMCVPGRAAMSIMDAILKELQIESPQISESVASSTKTENGL